MWLLFSISLTRLRHYSATAFLQTISCRHSTSTFQLYVNNPNKKTLYTINDYVCKPLDENLLRTTVQKHCATLPLHLEKKPIARHTLDAFQHVEMYIKQQNYTNTLIVLDSGCGTGRSSLLLGTLYPHHLIVGIDKSMARLSKNRNFRNGILNSSNDNDTTIPSVQQASSNVLLVRAECVDFWRLILQKDWNVTQHYLLYPNPYPKKSRYKNRWYAHASFPLLLSIGGNLVVRSNWKGYLEEFRKSVVIAHEYYKKHGVSEEDYALPYVQSCTHPNSLQRLDINTTSMAWTNFEQKYHAIGEPTYQLTLKYDNKETSID